MKSTGIVRRVDELGRIVLPIEQLLETVCADILALKDRDILCTIAENAGGLILLQHDGGPVHVDFQGILFRDVQRAAQFNGENDTP